MGFSFASRQRVPLFNSANPAAASCTSCGKSDISCTWRIVCGSGAFFRPFDRLRARIHLDHPVTAEHFLGLGERAVGHDGLAARKGDACAH
jgi:hypothetical protein